MKHLLLSFLLAAALFGCKQKDKKQIAPNAPVADTILHTDPAVAANADTNNKETDNAQKAEAANSRILLLSSPTFLFGDVGHLSFVDIQAHTKKEYEWVGDIPEIDSIVRTCGDDDICPELNRQNYIAIQQYKLMDIFHFNGEQLVPTGKKEMRWVITGLKKMGKRKR